MMTRLDDLRKRDPTSPELSRLIYDTQNRIYAHKRQKLRDFVETLDQKTDVTKLLRTIKGIDGRAKREAENEAITYNEISFSSSKQIATKFNQQFNTSKLGRHTSSSETRLVTRETKRKSLQQTDTACAWWVCHSQEGLCKLYPPIPPLCRPLPPAFWGGSQSCDPAAWLGQRQLIAGDIESIKDQNQH